MRENEEALDREDELSRVTGSCFTLSILDFISTVPYLGLHLSRNEAPDGHLRSSFMRFTVGVMI